MAMAFLMFLLFLFLVSLVFMVLGLAAPSILKKEKRSSTLIVTLPISAVLFLAIAVYYASLLMMI
ncbi:hypothetical protein [Jeotgalibacillus marinus]|uniref:Uncharacterized protein n=1 Tax=Jeotgalibacillus marinus TaxID=86667 RepID=A0ABV3Q7K3_9BACL